MSGTGGAGRFSHGPFYRVQSTTQTKLHAADQARSHTLLGKEARGSSLRSVKAYVGPLPLGQVGIEFNSITPRHGTHPHLAFWYEGHQDIWEVTHASDVWALIVIEVTKFNYP